VVVPELAGWPEVEQPTRTATSAAPMDAATAAKRLLMTIRVFFLWRYYRCQLI
jgi:hypothetical protein